MRKVTAKKGAQWAHKMALDGAFRVTNGDDVQAIAGEVREDRKVFLISLLGNWAIEVTELDMNDEPTVVKAVFKAIRHHAATMAVPVTQLPSSWDYAAPEPSADWWQTKAIEHLLKS